MRYLRFEKDGVASYGIMDGEDAVEVLAGPPWEDPRRTGLRFDYGDLRILTPTEPRTIFGVGLNFPDHIKELGQMTPTSPANFIKPLSSMRAHSQTIEIPRSATRVDYEGEMAVVLGRTIKDAEVEQAAEAIFGVTPFNDLTEREISYTPSLVTHSKAFDTFACFGPVIDTDIEWASAVVRTYLNGELVQEGRTEDMVFSAAEIVSYLSQGTTLQAGDVITTGTPEHVLGLEDGDRVEVEIVGMPLRLINTVVDLRKRG
jgi:2-keto-4-pentenoate hydratase/2-oxohepta-3-ene-1,7-dioic acid hydratase in catechol pathway